MSFRQGMWKEMEGYAMLIKIDFSSDEAIYQQLCNQIILGIATAALEEGQALPSPVDPTGVNAVFAADSDDETVELYTLSGVFVRCTKRSQLGLSSLAGSPAVVVLPNSVGGTPYIVRKQRLK